LHEAASDEITPQEKTPWAKTVRTCRQLLQLEPAMWLSRLKGWSRPTTLPNGQRPAVLWRRTSFGAQSQAGSVFVARMLTVVTTLHSQNVLEYLSQACQAARQICSIVVA